MCDYSAAHESPLSIGAASDVLQPGACNAHYSMQRIESASGPMQRTASAICGGEVGSASEEGSNDDTRSLEGKIWRKREGINA